MPKAVTALPWTITEKARNIHHIGLELGRVGDERWFLLQSDVHWDNPHCDRDLFLKHLRQAKERDAAILDNGDFFCCMQGRFDKRANKNDLRPEHRVGDYFDALVRTAADELRPYKHLLAVRGRGNHESGVYKNHETDLTERLVERLRVLGSETVKSGGYSGYVVFRVAYQKTRNASIKMFYHHGYGGGGPVTRGVIDTNRQAVFVSDCDLVWTGHSHDQWNVPIPRVRLNNDADAVIHTTQRHFRTPGYKEEYGDGYGGYHIEKGRGPKPVGGAWLRIYMADANTPDWEITEAR